MTHAKTMGDIKAFMLFRDFFPRLQARALSRYGVTLSERQFTNWREKGLISGPAYPQGRGRGLSPERHWPLSAYRRALRICWYKQRGIDRIPAWRILFWIAGEDVSIDHLRRSLKRELKRIRRQSRYLADSGFLRSTGVTTFEKAPSTCGQNPISTALDHLMQSPQMGISPELYRDVIKLDYEEADAATGGQVLEQAIGPLMGHDVSPDEIGVSLTDVWRPGHLSETATDYIGGSPDRDLLLARDILWARLRLANRLAPFAHLMGASRPASISFVWAFALAKRRTGSERLIGNVLNLIYQVADDRRCESDPNRRLKFLVESLEAMGCDGGGISPDEFKEAMKGFRERTF